MPANIICQACGGNKIMQVTAKDPHGGYICPNHDIDVDGNFPSAIGGGDYVEITICFDCGQLQGNWPKELPEKE